jgi:hypothetical protein
MRKLLAGSLALAALGAAVTVYRAEPGWDAGRVVAGWQAAVDPGPLSRAHAVLDGRCDACHTPMRGPDPAKCTACHADDRNLLGRPSTAFHATIGACRSCHIEHLGRGHVSRSMDHLALVGIAAPGGAALPLRRDNPLLLAGEASLDCAACHSGRDRHQGQFGADCAMCHATARWTIPGFAHPSASSTDCAQCHLEPPSHRMMHFHMVSKAVAGQEHAEVRQCFLCHRPTSWNDIKGVGHYKHH